MQNFCGILFVNTHFKVAPPPQLNKRETERKQLWTTELQSELREWAVLAEQSNTSQPHLTEPCGNWICAALSDSVFVFWPFDSNPDHWCTQHPHAQAVTFTSMTQTESRGGRRRRQHLTWSHCFIKSCFHTLSLAEGFTPTAQRSQPRNIPNTTK